MSWIFVGVLAALSVALGLLQLRAIENASRADRDRSRRALQAGIERVAREFDRRVAFACDAIVPPEERGPRARGDESERERSLAARYGEWAQTSEDANLFRRIALAIPKPDGGVELRELDTGAGGFRTAAWPPEWEPLHRQLETRAGPEHRGPRGPLRMDSMSVIERPLFGGGFGRPHERGWVVFELNLDYLRAKVFPDMFGVRASANGEAEIEVRIVMRAPPETVVYESGSGGSGWKEAEADAAAAFFSPPGPPRGARGGGPRNRPPAQFDGPRGGPPGRWLLYARYRPGSAEAMASAARARSRIVTLAIVFLMLATIGAMLRFTQRAQQLARLQMEFVAGITHELKTPLTVIQTAAHNLSRGLAGNTESYGEMIARQAGRLSAMVDQVLRFANTEAGRVLGALQTVWIEPLIREAAAWIEPELTSANCRLEIDIAPGLPPAILDPLAFEQALRNLLENAVKYGASGGWIGVSVKVAAHRKQIEIRVADRGPGIPRGEASRVFDPFFRGASALEAQIHGTGLGLSLVKRIAEAHGGSVRFENGEAGGTEFLLHLPAAADTQHALTDSAR